MTIKLAKLIMCMRKSLDSEHGQIIMTIIHLSWYCLSLESLPSLAVLQAYILVIKSNLQLCDVRSSNFEIDCFKSTETSDGQVSKGNTT